MKKKALSIISIVLVVCMMAVCVPFSASAATTEVFTGVQSGTQATLAHNWFIQLSAWKTTTGVCCTNDDKVAQPYAIQLRELYTGTTAKNLVVSEYKYASAPTADQQWMVFKFNIKNNSTMPIDVSDLLWSSYGYYNAAGDEIKVREVAQFNSAARKGLYYSPDIAAGQSADVWHAILIDKSVGFPTIQVPHTATETGAVYHSYLYTTPSNAGVAAPAAPTKQQMYAAIVANLRAQGNQYKIESDGSFSKDTFSLVLDPATNNITVTYIYDDKDATEPDGTFRMVLNPNLNNAYPFTMTGNYIDVGKVMSIKGTVPTRLDGNFKFHSYVGTDEFHHNDLKEASVEFAETAVSTLLGYVRNTIEKDASITMLGFDSKFLCPTGHNGLHYRYNNDATAAKDGTVTGLCNDCYERHTRAALGTKTGKTAIKNSALAFKDVVNGKWYKNAVDYAYSNSFISGMTTTSFGLNTSITRGMFITILARIAGVDTSANANKVATKFSDVPVGKYYTNAIKWGYENGIVSGTSSTTFSPENAITREQLCVMIVNFAKAYDVTIEAKNAEIKFTDDRSIASWSFIAVGKCQKAGIVSGYANASGFEFRPKNTATRAEAAQILYKFHSEFVSK